MLCTRCQKRPAQVHYKAVVNGQETSADLCGPCAAETGVALPGGPVNFPSLPPALAELFGLLSTWPARPTAASIARFCPHCKWTLERFQKAGLMGCTEGYSHFRAQAKAILERIHGATMHKGRRPPSGETSKGRAKQASAPELRGQLETAIRQEKFEEAAVLRDMLRRMEGGE